ncbi:hypothetical protein ES703_101846 [subsurface metagenome]
MKAQQELKECTDGRVCIIAETLRIVKSLLLVPGRSTKELTKAEGGVIPIIMGSVSEYFIAERR